MPPPIFWRHLKPGANGALVIPGLRPDEQSVTNVKD